MAKDLRLYMELGFALIVADQDVNRTLVHVNLYTNEKWC